MKKLYYSIGEVSELTSVEPHVLRYWETIFDELNPRKNRAGNRTYRERDITIVLELKELIQVKKYSTAGARKVLKKNLNQEEKKKELSREVKKDMKETRMFLSKLSDAL